MTDQVAENTRRARYIVTNPAGQSVFDITFPVSAIKDKDGNAVSPVSVYIDGTKTAAFSYDIVALKVTLSPAAPLGSIVTIEGERLIKRTTGYPLRGGLDSSLLNDDQNGVIEMLQEMRRDTDRSLILNKAEGDGIDNQLPVHSAGKALKWGPSGLSNSDVDIDDLDAALVDATDAATTAIAAKNDTTVLRDQTFQARDAAQAAASGQKWRPSVKAATTGNIALTGLQTIDGKALATGDRVLVRAQASALQNGVYTAAAGAWTRATDADIWDELVSQVVVVEEGATYADQAFICTANTGGVLNTTAIAWVSFNPPVVIASQAEAEANVENTKTMTSLRVWQKITALFATTAEIIAGTAGKIVSAASLAPMFHNTVVYQAAGQSVTTGGALTVLTFASEPKDDGGWHDTAAGQNSKIVPGITGWLEVIAQVSYPVGNNGFFGLYLLKNGVVTGIKTSVGLSASSGSQTIQINGPIDCVPTDYFEVAAAQGTGVLLTTDPAATWFSMKRRT